MKFIDRLFQREEMNGDGRCPTYLVRWTLLKLWGGRSVYLHHFVGDDWSFDLHDHPKRFISIGLKGAYIELLPWPQIVTPGTAYVMWRGPNDAQIGRTYRAPWIRTFPAEHVHRIVLLDDRRPCWTIVIVLKTTRPWGFWHGGEWIPWRQYVNSETATLRKSCP